MYGLLVSALKVDLKFITFFGEKNPTTKVLLIFDRKANENKIHICFKIYHRPMKQIQKVKIRLRCHST